MVGNCGLAPLVSVLLKGESKFEFEFESSKTFLDMTAAKALVNVRLLNLPRLNIHLTIRS
jgi:hypothetical protein